MKSTWLVLLSCREKSRCGACVAGDQWSLDHDAVNYLTQAYITSRRSARQPATHALADTGVHLFNAGTLIIISGPASIVEFHKLLIHHEQELSYRGLTYTCRTTSKQSRRHQNAENRLKGRFPSCRTQRNGCNARTVFTRKTQRNE